jgi:hypothetical protein
MGCAEQAFGQVTRPSQLKRKRAGLAGFVSWSWLLAPIVICSSET